VEPRFEQCPVRRPPSQPNILGDKCDGVSACRLSSLSGWPGKGPFAERDSPVRGGWLGTSLITRIPSPAVGTAPPPARYFLVAAWAEILSRCGGLPEALETVREIGHSIFRLPNVAVARPARNLSWCGVGARHPPAVIQAVGDAVISDYYLFHFFPSHCLDVRERRLSSFDQIFIPKSALGVKRKKSLIVRR